MFDLQSVCLPVDPPRSSSTAIRFCRGPRSIRDPILAVVLSGNARYQALIARLEAQMAATKLE